MPTQKKIGAGIALITAAASATCLLAGYLSPTFAVGAAVIGIVLGTGVARGAFSATPNAPKKN